MFSIYQTTDQGKRTRSQLLAILEEEDGLTRQELVAAGLTYDQVRRQTENLIFERMIYSRKDEAGRRRYYLRQKFMQNLSRISVSCMVLLLAWSVPVGVSNLGTDDDSLEESLAWILVTHDRTIPDRNCPSAAT